MGRLYSKLHASSIVRLCKQRKEIIKAAKYSRYDLVSSFDIYLDSLLKLGNTVNQYVEQEFVIFDFSCVNFEFPSDDSDSDLHHIHCDDHNEQEDNDEEDELCSLHISLESDDESIHTCKHHAANDTNNMGNKGKSRVKFFENTNQTPFNIYSNNIPHHDRSYGGNFNHMHMSHEDFGNYEHSQKKKITQRVDRYEHYGSKPFPMFVSPSPNHVVYETHNHGNFGHQNNVATASSPPPPPPPQAYSWNFLYPFSMNYEVPNYDHDEDERKIREREGIPDLEEEMSPFYNHNGMENGMRHGSGIGTSNVAEIKTNKVPNYDHGEVERKVREREGIPDLEEESELSSAVLPFCNHNGMENGMRHGSGIGTSNVAKINANKDLVLINEEKIKGNLQPKKTIQDIESLGTSGVGVTTPASSSKMSLKEAVLEIKNEFKHICDCGREFSSLIEAEKLPYHSVNAKLRVFASHRLRRIFPSVSLCLYPSYMSYQAIPKTKMLSEAKMQNYQDHTKFGDLSSTLEKLYVWEKKLYVEVLGEEKLRILYDKQYKRLKDLDKKGSEPDKIDDTLTSVKLLHSEISVAVKRISVISREINQLSNDKLLLELNKLIDGLIELWKIMSTSHQKQFQAISKASSHVHILDPLKKKKSSSKATLKLEKVILNWGMCFSNFINKQKSLAKHLNDWLQKRTLQETKKTEDEISPSLQGVLEAPPIFRVCNNWYIEINKISETEVSKAINNFASNLHKLYEKLKEEKALKARVKYLFKDYKQRLRSFCKKNGIHLQQYYSFIKMKASEDFEEAEIPLLKVSNGNLQTSRQRLIEERKRHKQVIHDVNDIASSCLQEGLTPIFEALWRFSLENLKIYEQLRLPK